VAIRSPAGFFQYVGCRCCAHVGATKTAWTSDVLTFWLTLVPFASVFEVVLEQLAPET
jgi:hypothetical protein